MTNKKIIIIGGYGTIGRKEYNILENLFPAIYDVKAHDETKGALFAHYDFAIICVPTPTVDGLCDTSYVEAAIKEVDADIYIVKSTVAVGTCERLAKELNKHIVHSPEHSGATQHCNNFEYDFTILGGDKADCRKVQQMYQEVFDARHRFKIVDSKTAELSKYMLNSFLATKVSFCVQFWQICQELDISYEELRECFIMDERVGAPHTFVYDEKPYWDSHCFNKDIPAIANQFDAKLLKDVNNFNTQCKVDSGKFEK